MSEDHEAVVPALAPAPRYVRPDQPAHPDRSCCLHCWTASRVRQARARWDRTTRRAARLSDRHAATWQAVGGLAVTVLIVVGVLAVGAAGMAVISGAWMRLGEAVIAGPGMN